MSLVDESIGSVRWNELLIRIVMLIWNSTQLFIHLIASLVIFTLLDGWKPFICCLLVSCVISAAYQYLVVIKQCLPIKSGDCVIITGTSSGIGRASVIDLLKAGYTVIATVRKPSDVDNLMHEAGPLSSRLTVLSGCDLTVEQSITSTSEAIKRLIDEGSLRLAGLVCNAGAAYAVPIELASRPHIDNQFELTVFGTMSLISHLRSLLEAHDSRLIVISSIVAQFPVPGMGLYSASKAALNACVDELRRELRTSRMRVVIIEPGQASTQFGSHVSSTSTVAEQSDLYSASAGRFMHLMFPSDSPSATVNAINIALRTSHPPAYMRAGYTSLPTGISVMLPYVVQDYTVGAAYRWPFVT